MVIESLKADCEVNGEALRVFERQARGDQGRLYVRRRVRGIIRSVDLIKTWENSPSRMVGEYRCLTRREPVGTRYRTFVLAPKSSAYPPQSGAMATVAETREFPALLLPR
jgi:hypothetical protein